MKSATMNGVNSGRTNLITRYMPMASSPAAIPALAWLLTPSPPFSHPAQTGYDQDEIVICDRSRKEE
ncbi:MAG: hypothetical protein BWY92_01066 [Firmicutes bacterium ADurb.BinA052]|nr:MAG: hypothetical protein BWY92_01066 [Firmicutes bacterium ADurb.BinA052]